jgi:hypothetical protein
VRTRWWRWWWTSTLLTLLVLTLFAFLFAGKILRTFLDLFHLFRRWWDFWPFQAGAAALGTLWAWAKVLIPLVLLLGLPWGFGMTIHKSREKPGPKDGKKGA